MSATKEHKHVSGAERIVTPDRIDETVKSLVARAQGKQLAPEQIVIKIERLENFQLRKLTALDVVTINTPDMTTGRSVASRILQSRLVVSEQAAMTAINHIANGAAPSGSNMRGAMIIDVQTGERLESDQERGVRASRFDWTGDAFDAITRKLDAIGLTHYRTREALALATKVAHAPGVIAELCWSDESDYTAGYVASQGIGYVRIPQLKLPGDPKGGRAFFVDKKNLGMEAFVNYLQKDAVLIADSGECSPAIEPDVYFNVSP